MNPADFQPKPVVPPSDAPVFERGLWGRAWFMLLLCLVFVAFDWELVPFSIFPVVFIFPVMLVAWNRSLWLAVICAVVMSSTRILHEMAFSPKPVPVGQVADSLICLCVLILVAALTTLLARQSRQLRRRVQQLEGMLPICSYCKSIRNEKDEWVRLEEYLSQHTEATLSHGLCPECARKEFGQFFPPKQ
jgi:K+-sensing histidine kinase KdpD